MLSRFKKLFDITFSHFTFEKYSFVDARIKCESIDYVQAIIKHAKFINIDDILNQLTFAH